MDSIYLTVPGITNSSENHWQSRWEREYPEKFKRIEQDEWDTPNVGEWVERIESVVRDNEIENTILIAHSLGCIAVAHWSKYFATKIKGAMLVAPSDCEAETYTFESTGFEPIPLVPLAFPSIVVASTDDQYATLNRSKLFADAWKSELINVGAKGHINPGSGFGAWDEGLEILKRLD